MSIRQELELDIAAALGEVDTLVAALEAGFASAGDSLAAVITTALDEFAAVDVVVTPTADTSSAVDAIVSDVEGLQPVVDVTTTPDIELLQSEVFAALADISPTVEPVADGTGIQASIEAAISDAVQAPIDTSAIEAEVAQAVGDGAASGLADVDTSGISSVGSSAQQAGAQVTTAFAEGGAAVKAFEFATKGATGSIAGTAGSIAKLAPGAAIFTAIGASAGALFHQAETTHASMERLDIVFGKNAESVQKIDIGGLTGDLTALARSAGSSASNVRQASANFGLFAQGFGASDQKILATTEQLQALSLRAVALNPSLGDAGDALQRLSGALITGRAKALAPFAIGLSQTEIAARASQIALADGRTEVTALDKVMAGAAISTEKLGSKLGTDFSRGIDQSAVKLKSLQKQIAAGLVQAGTPLVDPLISAATQLVPVASALASAVGKVLAATVPLAADLAGELAPSLVHAATSIGDLLDAAAPAADVIGTGFGGAVRVAATVLDALAKVIDLIPDPVIAIGAAFLGARFLVQQFGPAVVGAAAQTGLFIGTATEGIPILSAFGESAFLAGADAEAAFAASTGGISLLLGAIAAAAAAIGVFGGDADRATIDTDALAESLSKVADVADGTGKKAVDLGKNFADALKADQFGEFGKDLTRNSNELLHALSRLGLGAADLERILRSGADGSRTYADALLSTRDKSGELAKALAKTGLSFQQINDSANAAGPAVGDYEERLARLSGISEETAAKLVEMSRSIADQIKNFREAQQAEQDGAKAQLAFLDSTDKLTAAQKRQVAALDRQKGGTKDYLGLLDRVNVALDTAAARAEEDAAKQKAGQLDASGAFQQLATTVITGSGDMTDALRAFSDRTGVSDKDVQDFAASASKALSDLVSSVASSLPDTGDAISSFTKGIDDASKHVADVLGNAKSSQKDVKEAFGALADATDPQKIIANLNAQRDAVTKFNENVATLFASGNLRAAQEALKLGPEVGGAYAASLIKGGPQIESAANQALLGVDSANQSLLNNVQTVWGPQLATAFGQASADATGKFVFGLGNGAQSAAALQQNLDTVLATFGANSQQFADAAGLLGITTADALRAELARTPEDTLQAFSLAVATIQALAPGASTAAATVANGIAESWAGGVDQLTPTTAAALTNAATAVLAAQPELTATAAASALTIVETYGNVLTNGQGIPAKGTEAYSLLIGNIRQQIPALSAVAAEAAIAQAAAFDAHKGDISGTVDSEVAKIPPRIRAAERDLQSSGESAGAKIPAGIKTGIESGTPAATSTATSAGSDVGKAFGAGTGQAIAGANLGIALQAVGTISSSLGGSQIKGIAGSAGDTVGAAFDTGMGRGIAENSAGVQSAARRVVSDAERAAKDQAGIKSPSKVFAAIGGQLTDGLAGGIASRSSKAQAAASSVVKTIADQVTADIRKAAADAQAAADAAQQRADTTNTDADRQAAQKAADDARSAQSDAEAAFRAAERAAEGVQRQAADLMETTAKATEDALTNAVDAAKATASDQVGRSSAALISQFGASITSLGAGARFGLTTGAVSLADVIAPVADSIGQIISEERTAISGAFDQVAATTTKTLDAVTSRATRTLDVLVNGVNAQTVIAQPRAAVAAAAPSVTVASAPTFAQALVGAVPTTSLSISVVLPPGLGTSTAQLQEVGRIVGNAAAGTLAERGITAEVRAG